MMTNNDLTGVQHFPTGGNQLGYPYTPVSGQVLNYSPKTAKEFLEQKIKTLRDKVTGLKLQLVNAENELYEHEKDLNKLVS